MKKKLLVINTEQCLDVPFEQQVTIGRDVYNTLALPDPEISRSHAIIFEQDQETIVKDLKSRNGTWLRGERVTDGVLAPGDEIIVGSTVILYEPDEDADLQTLLSRRGRFLIEKRDGGLDGLRPNRETESSFTLDELGEALDRLLFTSEGTTYFTMTGAIQLLQAVKEMDDAQDTTQLFEATLRRAMELAGGHRGVIMECDESRRHLKVRSIHSAESSESIMIAQPILRLLLGAERAVYCPNIRNDKRYAQIAVKCQRPIHSFAAVPIRGPEELIGFLYIDSESDAVSYDLATLRALYFLTHHLGALLRKRPTHFVRQPAGNHNGSSPAAGNPAPAALMGNAARVAH